MFHEIMIDLGDVDSSGVDCISDNNFLNGPT